MSIRVIDAVCPQTILPMSVTCDAGTLCITNIPSRNPNNTQLYSTVLNETVRVLVDSNPLSCMTL